MITKRLLVLLTVLLAGLSCIYLLPKHSGSQPVGIVLELPDYIGQWYGVSTAVTQKEKDVLGRETEFCRKLYSNGLGDQIYVSIVLGGQDMNTSIHRPERCLPAQGFTIVDSRIETIPLSPQPLSVTRLHDVRPIGKPGEQSLSEYSLNYYWFVGCTETTPSHTSRNLIDIRDRLLQGYNQRWAYVTVMSPITKSLTKFGRSEKETDNLIKGFIQQLLPLIRR